MEEELQRHEVCPIERVPGLYLTDWVGASTVNEVNILGITHILSILSNEEFEQYGPDESPGVELRHLDLKDDAGVDFIKHFAQECDWLDKILSHGFGGAVIVHCQQGISRSTTLVVAYLMRRLDMKFEDAYALVKKSRNIVNLNAGFEEQLRAWEQKLRESKAKETLSPKSPIETISPFDVIDYVEAQSSEGS